jgi:dimethylglycine dehydrogenase
MQTHARVVVIGGGVVGCSALYHLARLGWRNLLLLERDELTAGSTWHAAGNCPNYASAWSIMRLQRASTRLYATLAELTGQPIAYHVTGSIRLAHTRDRMDEFHHIAAMANAQDIPFAVLTPAGIAARYDGIETHDLLGGLYDPLDGDIDPSQLTAAFAKGARDLGARIQRTTRVTGLSRTAEGWRIETTEGTVTAEMVVNAAGYRAGEVMALLGQHLPVVSMQHQYLVTEPIPALAGRAQKLPLLRDPDTSWYLRQERDGLLLGPYEADATPAWLDGIPEAFAGQLFPDDLARLTPQIEDAIGRVPMLGSVGVRRVVNGPIPYSPDGNPYIGPAPGLPNFFHCCVFSFGIVQAGGAGQALAEWVVNGEPGADLWSCDPRRFGDYATRSYAIARATEVYRHEYAVAFPREARPAGRPARVSPLYPLLRAKGAIFAARGGWEQADWFARDGEADRPSFRRDVPGFAAVAAECQAMVSGVGVLERVGLTKLMVEGPGAAAWLDRTLCTRLPRPGRTTRSWLLNERGGIVSTFTVTRLADDRWYLVSSALAETHDPDTLTNLLPDDGSVRVRNISATWGTILLAGPRAHDVLCGLAEVDLSGAAFPRFAARYVEIGYGRPLVLRLGIAAGWELHAPLAELLPLYEAAWRVGEPLGIADVGQRALDSLRLEAGVPIWKSDLTRDTSPIAAGFERLIDFARPAFPGRAALLRERSEGPRERLVSLRMKEVGVADAPACAPVWADGQRVGLTSSGGWGHPSGYSLALAYVRADLACEGRELQVDILGERRAAVVRPDQNSRSTSRSVEPT